jgi:hypothetical protein
VTLCDARHSAARAHVESLTRARRQRSLCLSALNLRGSSKNSTAVSSCGIRTAKRAYVHYDDYPVRRGFAKLLTRDKARQVAANIAKLPADATPDAALTICERVAKVQALLDDHLASGKHSAADVVAQAQAILSESAVLRAMCDIGYFPPSTPTPVE